MTALSLSGAACRTSQHVEPLIIGGLLLATLVLPGSAHWRPLPAGVYASGVVFGAVLRSRRSAWSSSTAARG